MITIIDDYTERVVTVRLDDEDGGDLDEYTASVIASNHVGPEWTEWDTERVNYDKIRVRFRL